MMSIKGLLKHCGQFIQQQFVTLTKPATKSLAFGSISDLTRTNKQLIAENALLRQQLIVLNRQVKRPNFKPLDKFRLVILASLVHNWRNALLILQPDTILKWHRQGFKLIWKIKSKPKKRGPRIDQDTIALIRRMAQENPLWGAERHPQVGTRGRTPQAQY